MKGARAIWAGKKIEVEMKPTRDVGPFNIWLLAKGKTSRGVFCARVVIDQSFTVVSLEGIVDIR